MIPKQTSVVDGVATAGGQPLPNEPVGPQDDAVTALSRWQRTAIAAFYRAEARGFAPGAELDDWLAAEREIDAAEAQGESPGRSDEPAVVAAGPGPARKSRPAVKRSAAKRAAGSTGKPAAATRIQARNRGEVS